MRERKNVYKLPAGDTTLQWYSRAVIEMKRRPSTDPRSWNYQAAMHGFDANQPLWRNAAPYPGQTEQAEFWNQCQHGSWFFLPWHRMYLAYFEEIVAQTIVDLGGPANWALPYWDYSESSNPNALNMPLAFTSPANATNGLWMAGRQSNTIPVRYVTLKALNTIPFTGDGITSPLGFGGPETTFSHRGGTHGELESLPHDMVHVAIGGAMGRPNTAALDPIFWLHHANIDRLWQVWLNMGRRSDPNRSAWLDFKFRFHDKSGNPVEMKCSQVRDTKAVLSGYTYQDVPSDTRMLERTEKLMAVDASMPLDVIAATNEPQVLGSAKTTVSLKLSPVQKGKMRLELMNEAAIPAKTTILHFENITGKGVPPIHDVYLNVPKNDKNKEAFYAGSLSFFGVEESSMSTLHHPGSGQHYALDITELVKKLRSSRGWKEQELDVSLEPSKDMDQDAAVTIGRISLYSE